jgi:hypothetical protein
MGPSKLGSSTVAGIVPVRRQGKYGANEAHGMAEMATGSGSAALAGSQGSSASH